MSTTNEALRGQAALVTGGGSGIGLAAAGALLRDGATVTIVGRTAETPPPTCPNATRLQVPPFSGRSAT